MKYYFLAFVILLNFSCNSGEKQKKDVSVTVVSANGEGKPPLGDWKRTCDGISYLSVTPEGGELVVNDNQINIKIRITPVPASPGAYNIKLFKAGDLGAGGMGLNWDSFSTDSTVAQLRLIKPGKAIFSWFGFFNKQTGKREWVDQSDLNLETGNNAIDLQKCN